MVENFKMKGISISKTTVQVKKKSGSQILVHRRPYTGIPGKYRGAAVYTAVYTAAFPGAAVYTGISPERHPTPMLIVLVLSNCQLGHDSATRVTPEDDRRPRTVIYLNPGVVPQPTPAVPLGCINALGRGLVHVNGRICFGFCHAYVHRGSQVP